MERRLVEGCLVELFFLELLLVKLFLAKLLLRVLRPGARRPRVETGVVMVVASSRTNTVCARARAGARAVRAAAWSGVRARMSLLLVELGKRSAQNVRREPSALVIAIVDVPRNGTADPVEPFRVVPPDEGVGL